MQFLARLVHPVWRPPRVEEVQRRVFAPRNFLLRLFSLRKTSALVWAYFRWADGPHLPSAPFFQGSFVLLSAAVRIFILLYSYLYIGVFDPPFRRQFRGRLAALSCPIQWYAASLSLRKDEASTIATLHRNTFSRVLPSLEIFLDDIFSSIFVFPNKIGRHSHRCQSCDSGRNFP